MAIRKIKGKTFRNVMKEHDNEVEYPRLHIDLDHIPEAKKWSVGETYKITLHVKQKLISEDSVGFDIVGIEAGEKVGGSVNKKKNKPRRYAKNN